MLSGFVQYPDGNVDKLDRVDAIREAHRREGTILWVDLAAPSETDVTEIGAALGLAPDAIDDCLHGEQRPRIDEFEGYAFMVLYGMLGTDEEAEPAPRKLGCFLGERFLVTVHREPLHALTSLRARCERHASQVIGRGVDVLLYMMIDQIVDNYIVVAQQYEDQVDRLEDISLHDAADETILAEAMEVRRRLLDLRRMAVSQQELLMPLARGEYAYVSESLERRFWHVQDHLRTVVDVVEGQRELLNNIRENYHMTLAAQMNAVMKTLTMFATLLLPLSLVAGIYGMNVPLWPPQDSPLSFWFVLGLMVAAGGASVVFFRRRRWL